MIIPLDPSLEGLAEKRFFSVARQILARQSDGDSARIGAIVEAESRDANIRPELNGQAERYAACVRVLGDLAQLRWTLVESGYGLELHSPRGNGRRGLSPAGVLARKEEIRRELRPRVLQQFENKDVRSFIRRLERPAGNKTRSIRLLIADGAELQQRLAPARRWAADEPARVEALAAAIQPYLELVEPGARDTHTGLLLHDIWRYFRFTWSIPQATIPGRKLLYLVRDGAHPHHAVIGIAGLSNCAVQMVPRDRFIGWSTRGVEEALRLLMKPARVRRREEQTGTGRHLAFQGVYRHLCGLLPKDSDLSLADQRVILQRAHRWLLDGIEEALGEIELHGLVTTQEVAAPSGEVIDRLRRLYEEFAGHRQAALTQRGPDPAASELPVVDPDQPQTPAELEEGLADGGLLAAPVDEALLNLEAKHTSNKLVHDSRRMLVRKKRAFELARLLDAKRLLTAHARLLTEPSQVFDAIQREDIRAAVNTAMTAIKGRRVGTNILEITTCGAIEPYNQVLGGKLVALLLLSPQIGADYRKRYGKEPTIIRSQLKNAPVVPDNTLVWLGTTSLFSHGSSQYERLRLPAGVIAADQPEIRFHYIGDTTGYGTVQFSDETVRMIGAVMRDERGYRDVNGVFGEGASPKLRKLRSGLDALGFNPELLMLHHQERRIYAAPLCADAGAYLCGVPAVLPDYIRHPERYRDAGERIADFWRRRWLARRIDHGPAWQALGASRGWLLSALVPTWAEPATASAPAGDNPPAGQDDPADGPHRDEIDFWRRLAQAGANAIAEGLSDREFERLHLTTELEDLLLDRAQAGSSIILTGNAGDGKTHLARAIERRLGPTAARFEFALDATALMTRQHGALPVLERWRGARAAGKGFVLAINQYPLYRLRADLRRHLPEVLAEVERQWSHRLVYLDEPDAPVGAEALVLVDLSLRNPLAPKFAGAALERLLTSPAVISHASSGVDANFTSNHQALSHPLVRQRLLALFERVISAGGRATVRELWILCARLLFGTERRPETPGAERSWYSERLFQPDARFPLTHLLRRFADPAGVTHPQIDRRLEAATGTQATDWLIDRQLPEPAPARLAQGRDKYRDRFVAVKRRFYFEHREGGPERLFALDESFHGEFHNILRDDKNDTLHLQHLIEAINRCYYPAEFEGVRDKLFLWIGHRLHEQPTISYVASDSIPRQRLRLRRPHPPAALTGPFEYLPDHLLLVVGRPDGTADTTATLRIDADLYATLAAIQQGLPRHLVDPGELNRLDAFVDRIRQVQPEPGSDFLVYNAEHVLPGVIQMAADYSSYLSVRRASPARSG